MLDESTALESPCIIKHILLLKNVFFISPTNVQRQVSPEVLYSSSVKDAF